MSNFLGDLRYAWRMFAKNPGFTGVAILSLALGIGANTAIFSLLNAILLKMIPVKDPAQLVVFGNGLGRGFNGEDDAVNRSNTLYSYPLYKDLTANNELFDGVAAIASIDFTVYVRQTDTPSGRLPEAGDARVVSGNYFQVLGVQPALGRAIQPEDDKAGSGQVVVLSDGYWHRRFAADPSIVGRSLIVNNEPFQVVGVAPKGFRGETFGWNPDMWTPMVALSKISHMDSLLDDRITSFLMLVGRLNPGVTVPQATTVMSLRFQQALRAEAGGQLSPEREKRLSERRIDVTPAHEALSSLRREAQAPLLLLMAVVGAVLLIACANVANLLLARAASRRKEIGVRLALGAGRARLIRQLLTESILLGITGGALGLLLAPWALQALVGMLFTGTEVVPIDIDLDARVLAFTCGISVLAGLLFGLSPALRSTRLDLLPALKVNSRGTIGERSRFGLSKGLVVSQVALSLLLMVGAALLIGSLRNLRSLDLGFRPNHVLAFQLDPRGGGYQQGKVLELYRRVLESVRAIPGVKSASLSFRPLLSGARRTESIHVEGYQPGRGEENAVRVIHVSPGYFDTVGMTLLDGRPIDDRDREGSAPVAVVNRKFMDRYFAAQNGLGKHLGFDGPNEKTDIEIIGVVADAKYNDLREDVPEVVFVPVFQRPEFIESLEIRTSGEPAALIVEVRRVLGERDRNLPIREVTTLNEQIDRRLRGERLVTLVTTFFGLLALLLASIGLFGVMSYAVSRRTSEIGIRMALGAERGSVLWMVLRESLALVVLGIAAGLIAAVACTRLLAGLLYETSPTDPLAISAATAVLLAVAALAAYLPARRAARVDPMVALRYE